MAYPIQIATTGTPIVFGPMVLSSDHITATGDLHTTVTVTISKNGGAFGSPSGAISWLGNGWYAIAGNATDSGTAGPIAVHASVATNDPFDQTVAFVVDPTVALFGANAVQIAGAAAAVPGASGGMLINGANSGSITLADVTITGTAAAGATPAKAALTLAGGAASTTGGGTAGAGLAVMGGAGAATTNGAAVGAVVTAGGVTTVSGNDGMQMTGTGNGSGLNATGTGTNHGIYANSTGTGHGLMGKAGGSTGIGIIANSVNSHGFQAQGGSNGNGMEILGAGTGHGIYATSGTGAIGDGINAASMATAGNGMTLNGSGTGDGLRAISGTGASGNGITATAMSTNGNGMTLALAGTGLDLNATKTPLQVTVATNNDKTGYTLTGAYDPAKTALSNAAQTESYRANGATGTVPQLLYEIVAHLGESAISGTTKTINKIDHATAAETFTLDSATTPSSITRAT